MHCLSFTRLLGGTSIHRGAHRATQPRGPWQYWLNVKDIISVHCPQSIVGCVNASCPSLFFMYYAKGTTEGKDDAVWTEGVCVCFRTHLLSVLLSVRLVDVSWFQNAALKLKISHNQHTEKNKQYLHKVYYFLVSVLKPVSKSWL